MKLLFPTSVPTSLTLTPENAGIHVAAYDPAAVVPEEHRDAAIVISWMNPPDQLQSMARDLPQLRLVQGLGSGADWLVAAGFRPDVAIARGIDLHNNAVAEHCLALTLAAARRLDLARDAQRDGRWAEEITGNQLTSRSGFTQISGSRFVIWGMGQIGLAVAVRLRALGADIVGVARSSGTREGFEVVSESEALACAPQADALIAILPEEPSTLGLIGEKVFDAMSRDAWFINVGRGKTVDDRALIQALTQGRIAGAALDVFSVEPLPATSELWNLPNVIMTPHSAGGRPSGIEALVNENLRRLSDGRPLLGEVLT